jgi:hypothetical protein
MTSFFYHCFTTFILVSSLSFGQSFETRRNQFFVMNTLTSGVISGIGSAIHKHPGQTRGKAFLIGFGKGCIGGSLQFTGKYMLGSLKPERDYWYAWSAKIVHASGASIVENAAMNKPLWYNFAMDYGPLRFDIRMNGKMKLRLMPASAGGMVLHWINGNKFRPDLTLKTGNIVFQSKIHPEMKGGQNVTYANSISVDYVQNNRSYSFYFNQYSVTAHELIHSYQYREWLAINSYYCKNEGKFIYWDFPVFMVPYMAGNIGKYLAGKRYYDNPFELEAESLSRRNPVNWDDRVKGSMPKIYGPTN